MMEVFAFEDADATGAHPGAPGHGGRVRLDALRHSYGGVTALRPLHLDIPAGQFVAVVGRAGAGKSTLARLVAGLESATGGAVEVAGEPVRGPDPRVALLPGRARPVPWRRIIDNVARAAGPGGRQATLRALRAVGLEHLAQDGALDLPSAHRQRLALARALAGRPRVLLLDEPFAGLGGVARRQLGARVTAISRRRGCTILLLTRDVADAVDLADRAVVLRDGTLGLDLPLVRADGERETDSPASAALRARILAAV